MTRHSRRAAATAAAAALSLLAAGAGAAHAAPAARRAAASIAPGAVATGAPGAASSFDLARKDCLGTARNTTSKVWYTVADGVLSDVYEPTVDNTDVSTLQYLVTDGSTFTDLQTRDMTYTVQSDESGMACTVTSTDAEHGYRLRTVYVTDPLRDTVLMHTSLSALPGSHVDVRALRVYARLDAHVNGDGGGGSQNGGANTGVVDAGSRTAVVYSDNTVTQAANRTYAVPTYMDLAADTAGTASVGYAGTAGDGLTELDATHTLTPVSTSAPDGHIVATEDVTPRQGGSITLALGFGRTQAQSVATAAASLRTPFDQIERAYTDGWRGYDDSLLRPPSSLPGIPAATVRRTYYLDADVLKASEDKTFPGAIVASLASPWGQAVNAGTLVGGEPVYYGSYREVFGRDLYEAFTGLMADGDVATARATTLFLLDEQQLPTGEIPRNSLVNGRAAPDTGGDQLDETAYPILMAYLSGLSGDDALWSRHLKPAADFLVSHGPAYGVERWEEQSGYSPSTIAAEIAGLTAASAIAARHGDRADAQLYQATADDFQRQIKDWTVTSTGPDSGSPYFIRLSKTGDPNATTSYSLGNGGPAPSQDAVIDGGFQELVRLGELPPNDPDFTNSLSVLDKQLSVSTPSGTGYYRYGDSAATGSADGYGDCSTTNSQTSCTTPGQPWPTTDTGTGHVWPVLSGERAESAIATGDRATAASLLSFMIKSASGVGLVPEQVWEDPDLPASPYGSDPTTASIGFTDGQAAGSASPLTWAQAQELRLITDLGQGRAVDRPALTTARYVTHGAPGTAAVTLTSPSSGATVEAATATVTGSTTPGAAVVVQADDTDTGAAANTVSTRADATGAFSVPVAVGFGSDQITVAATTATGATGYARTSVTGDITGGTSVLDVTDPSGDDNGPGSYQYPTDSAFTPGSFDLTRFQVITQGGTVYLRTTLKSLTPTFGNTMGAQLLDIYVHDPAAEATSTAAPYPTRDYSIAPADAWNERLEVQGFAAPVWVNAVGGQVGTPTAVVASTASDSITVALPESAFGTPTSGWTFTLALAGQDGYSPDLARAFAATPQPYSFGVCPVGGTARICSADPGTVAKVMDTITPPGVSQATELDSSRGPVVLQGVTVP
ncbi:glucodextranase DOMON-like domain-containing protein [Streptacidiphilus sp. P02-A3a]|uniref:glucodextranase DOMON-like domain-containing protein n=1 Tax=Streptacidiphilus sp. P02-A3a TaxID=2704468 RepID=UPI0015F9A63D|nr:glucodextranase DOMON-like domain-containing protein [Streptacidiphilus sp. P02-A3a]QMU68787.1 glucan 1,4-alpha-glucosidase [Streptacidiphilus sp. P02-A3a]